MVCWSRRSAVSIGEKLQLSANYAFTYSNTLSDKAWLIQRLSKKSFLLGPGKAKAFFEKTISITNVT